MLLPIPKTSPVDFISGPKIEFASLSFSKEKTGTFTAKDGILKLQANGKEQTYSYRVSGDNMTLTSSQLSITYDKMDDDIRTIFSNAEKTYQQRFK